jgi:hypothetical protein
MRVQHQESLPLSRKPPTKKRKIAAAKDDDSVSVVDVKKEAGGGDDDEDYEAPGGGGGAQQQATAPDGGEPAPIDFTAPVDDDDEEMLDLFARNPSTSPDFLRYTVTLAKYRYVIAEHEVLLGELEMLRVKEARVTEQKDHLFDNVLRKEIGSGRFPCFLLSLGCC